MNPSIGLALGVIAASFSSLFIKLSDAPTLTVAFYRLTLTVILLMPYTLYKHGKEISALSKNDIFKGVMSGVFLALHFVTWFASLNYTTVASSTVLVTTQPIFVVIGSYIFFKEKIPLMALVGGAIALAGGMYIGLSDFTADGKALLGDALALAGAIAVSGYFLFGRFLRKNLSLLPYVLLVYGSGSVVLFISMLVTDTNFIGYAFKDYALFLALAVVCTIFGHTVFNWALKYIKAPVVSVAILGEPIGASVWAALLLSEYPSWNQVVGAAIILLGLLVFTRAMLKYSDN